MKCENCKKYIAQYVAEVIDGTNIALCEVCNNNSPNVMLPFEFERVTVFVNNEPNIYGFHYTVDGEKQRRKLQVPMPQVNFPFFSRALGINGKWTYQD